MEPSMTEYYNTEPTMVKVIEGMNKELEDSQKKVEQLERLLVDKRDIEKKYKSLVKNLLVGIIENAHPDYMEGGLSLMPMRGHYYNEREYRKFYWETLYDLSEELDEDDWNDDGGHMKICVEFHEKRNRRGMGYIQDIQLSLDLVDTESEEDHSDD